MACFFADFAVRLTETGFDLFSDFFLLDVISFICGVGFEVWSTWSKTSAHGLYTFTKVCQLGSGQKWPDDIRPAMDPCP